MPTVTDRYEAATRYVRRAIAAVESPGLAYARNPITDLVEWYAAPTKTEPARRELARLESRWLRATTDPERERIARETELLADRVQESLPGAPQDRTRTNLGRSETQTSTAATSYLAELERESNEVWAYAKSAAATTSEGARSLARWLLLGGALVVGWRAFGYLNRRERRVAIELNDALGRVANRRRAREESR